jgi:hypothetical protein
MFDSSPHRNVGQPWIDCEVPWAPDELLVSTLVAHGQPRFSAEQLRTHGGARFYALRFWEDVQAAAKGDREAQERVDYCREMWGNMRRIELISDRPAHTIGLWER